MVRVCHLGSEMSVHNRERARGNDRVTCLRPIARMPNTDLLEQGEIAAHSAAEVCLPVPGGEMSRPLS